MKKIVFAAIAALLPGVAAAHDGIDIQDAYARSTNPKTGAAFMQLRNHSDVDCRLVGASSDVAERVELHTHKEVDGIMKMVEIEEGFGISAYGSRMLRRGGDHVMFLGLNRKLGDGDVIVLSLDFGDCGVEEIEVTVDNERQPAESGKMMEKTGADH